MKVLAHFEGEYDRHRGKFLSALLRYERESLVGVISLSPTASLRRLLAAHEIPLFTAPSETPSEVTRCVLCNLKFDLGGVDGPVLRRLIEAMFARDVETINGTHASLREIFPEQASSIRDLRTPPNGMELPYFRGELLGRNRQLRVLGVGMDSNIGKMTLALELRRELRVRGLDPKFVATGQIGICLEGEGIPLDAAPLDFARGLVEEELSRHHQEILLIEGQGSLFHPVYSNTAISLLHGSCPQQMILCGAANQATIRTIPQARLPSYATAIRILEDLARVVSPESTVVGLTMITDGLAEDAARRLLTSLQSELGIPVTDVVRFGPAPFADSIEAWLRRRE